MRKLLSVKDEELKDSLNEHFTDGHTSITIAEIISLAEFLTSRGYDLQNVGEINYRSLLMKYVGKVKHLESIDFITDIVSNEKLKLTEDEESELLKISKESEDNYSN